MVITIHQENIRGRVPITCKDQRFINVYGNAPDVAPRNLLSVMTVLSEWVNNELGEECLFEVD